MVGVFTSFDRRKPVKRKLIVKNLYLWPCICSLTYSGMTTKKQIDKNRGVIGTKVESRLVFYFRIRNKKLNILQRIKFMLFKPVTYFWVLAGWFDSPYEARMNRLCPQATYWPPSTISSGPWSRAPSNVNNLRKRKKFICLLYKFYLSY